MRKTVDFTHRLVSTNTVSSMISKRVFMKDDDDTTDVIMGLSLTVKFFIVFFIQLPCLCMNIFLLWIGSRWLVATLGFDELVLNAIALEFVLNVHEMIFAAAVPYSMKQKLKTVLVAHPDKAQGPTWSNMFGTFGLLIVAVVWTALYIRDFQQVLPDYQWDIAAACNMHVEKIAFV